VGGRANAAEPFWLEWGHGPDDSGLSVNFDRDVIAHRWRSSTFEGELVAHRVSLQEL
jgi:hypothetical protein